MTARKQQVVVEATELEQQPTGVEQAVADLRLLPKSDQEALAAEKGFDTVEEYLASIGFVQEEDPVVEIYIPALDANDIVIPGLGRTVKVRQSAIDDFVTNHAPTAGLSLAKFKPRPEDIVY
jgi:hypothetical protein